MMSSEKNRINDEFIHVKCRYPNEYVYRDKIDDGKTKRIRRSEVPSELIPWSVPFDHYDPIHFTAPFVLTASWADKTLDDETFKPKWNAIDGKVDRNSHQGIYGVSKQNEPLNVVGRTGLKGRGVLGRWGPNHAADPIVTRWKRDEGSNKIVEKDGKKILQFVAIQRRDTGEWAIPGGMVDPGEQVSLTVRREFMEEALDSTAIKSAKERRNLEEMVNAFFASSEQQIYSGYVDDPRNTDNSWMETTAFLFHDETGEEIGKFELKAGDDAKNLMWMDIGHEMNLYASHKEFLKRVAEIKESHW